VRARCQGFCRWGDCQRAGRSRAFRAGGFPAC
jgi:hypothetical protein